MALSTDFPGLTSKALATERNANLPLVNSFGGRGGGSHLTSGLSISTGGPRVMQNSPRPSRLLSDAGYDRLTGTGFPFFGAVALDVLDPVLYDALVADGLASLLPEAVSVRTLRYENPFWASLFGKGRAEGTVSTAVQVLEVARDYGPNLENSSRR